MSFSVSDLKKPFKGFPVKKKKEVLDRPPFCQYD